MIAFIDAHRAIYGVEPICRVLPIAPSTYHAQAAKRADPVKWSAWAQRDAILQADIRRVRETNFQVYGVRKVWRQPHATRAHEAHGPGGCGARQDGEDHAKRPIGAAPARPGEPAIPAVGAERLVGVGFHLRRHLAGLCLRRRGGRLRRDSVSVPLSGSSAGW